MDNYYIIIGTTIETQTRDANTRPLCHTDKCTIEALNIILSGECGRPFQHVMPYGDPAG